MRKFGKWMREVFFLMRASACCQQVRSSSLVRSAHHSSRVWHHCVKISMLSSSALVRCTQSRRLKMNIWGVICPPALLLHSLLTAASAAQGGVTVKPRRSSRFIVHHTSVQSWRHAKLPKIRCASISRRCWEFGHICIWLQEVQAVVDWMSEWKKCRHPSLKNIFKFIL